MSRVNFSSEDWARVKETYRKWWAGELERPIVPVELTGRDLGEPPPAAPLLSQETCADLSVSAEPLIDRIDYELGTRLYLGDAFPVVNLDVFGPGIAGAFLGAHLDNATGRVWFHAPADTPISELHLQYDPDNVWFRRIKDVCAAAMACWGGRVLIGMPDLGGTLDILSTFRPGEQLLLDLYDHPDEVKRLTWEIHSLWHRYYDEINAVLEPVNPGYSDWSRIYSDRPGYILQCDFSYMLGPKMFEQFVRPELAATTQRLARSFYHLDGVGQLPHLRSLLEIETLDGVQWVPGDGKPDCDAWPEVYRQIAQAGKKIQVNGNDFDVLDAVVEQTRTPGLIHKSNLIWPLSREAEARARLARYSVRER